MPYIYKSGLQFGITETNIYGSSDYIELTQAEYDALSTAEKHNGQIYFITDSNYDYVVVNDSVPIGSIQAYGGLLAPNNWLICDGSAVSRSDYYELFQVLGTTYGAGDGNTTFNLPDLRGKVTIGKSNSYQIGAEGGKESLTLTAAIGTGNNAASKIAYITNDASAYQNSQINVSTGHYFIASASSMDTTPVTTWNHGVAVTEHEVDDRNVTNMQPYLVTNYIIKAKNPSLTSGQQLQMLEMCYPVGSYFETSNNSFDPNIEWGGTWINEAQTDKIITNALYNTTTADFTQMTYTLSDSATNYDILMITFNDNDNVQNTISIYKPVENIDYSLCSSHSTWAGTAMMFKHRDFRIINGNIVMQTHRDCEATFTAQGTMIRVDAKNTAILSVIGIDLNPQILTLTNKWHRTA